jgi:hypothetical protein
MDIPHLELARREEQGVTAPEITEHATLCKIGGVYNLVERGSMAKGRSVDIHPEDIQGKQEQAVETDIEECLLVGLVHHSALDHEHEDSHDDSTEGIDSNIK